MKKIVVLTGAGMSAQSASALFTSDSEGWENHPVEVASIEGWYRNPGIMLDFITNAGQPCKGAAQQGP